jgi:hypothetical protein
MMKSKLGYAIVLLAILSLSGCELMFQLVGTNVFAGLDVVKVDLDVTAADLNSKEKQEDYIDDVEAALDTGYLDEEDNADTVVTVLTDIYQDTGNDEQVREEAALLAGEVILETNILAYTAVNNLSGIIESVSDGTSSGENFVETAMAGIFGEGATAAEIEAVLLTFQEAAAAYRAYADLLDSSDTVPDEAVQPALMVIVADTLISAVGIPALTDAIVNNTLGGLSAINDVFDQTDDVISSTDDQLQALIDFSFIGDLLNSFIIS